jgi:hypothetical protein
MASRTRPIWSREPRTGSSVKKQHRRVTTGRNRDVGRGYFSGFLPRHQRIGTRRSLTCSRRCNPFTPFRYRKQGRRLVYTGKLERGFTEKTRSAFLRFERLKTKRQPIEADRKFPKARWMKPEALIDAEFRRKTGEGLLCHPSFKGLRDLRLI